MFPHIKVIIISGSIKKRVTRQGRSRHSSSRANFLFLNLNCWPSFLQFYFILPYVLVIAWIKLLCVLLVLLVIVIITRIAETYPRQLYHKQKVIFHFYLQEKHSIMFPLVTSLKRVGLKLNLKISILQTFFSYIRTSNSLNQASLRPFCHRNNNQNRWNVTVIFF